MTTPRIMDQDDLNHFIVMLIDFLEEKHDISFDEDEVFEPFAEFIEKAMADFCTGEYRNYN